MRKSSGIVNVSSAHAYTAARQNGRALTIGRPARQWLGKRHS
ncbi:MAG TPA: hypothetical protein VGH98_20675 [Gemmatimonadaceae bacterium]